MDSAAIIADIASARLSLSQVAARHGLSLDALAAFIVSDQAQPILDQLQCAAAITTRLVAQLHLPIAVAALGTLLSRHRAAAFVSPAAAFLSPAAQHAGPSLGSPQHGHPISTDACQTAPPVALAPDQPDPTSSATPTSQPSPRDHARALRHQVELRRAAATLLRYANFNPHARTNSPASPSQHATTQPANSHGSAAHAPPSINTPADFTHPISPLGSAHPAAPTPGLPRSSPLSTPFTADQPAPHFASFAELFAAAIASVNSAGDHPAASPDDADLSPDDFDLCPDDVDGSPDEAGLSPDVADNTDTQAPSPDHAAQARTQSVEAQPAPVPSTPFTSSSPARSNLSTPCSSSSLTPSATPFPAPPCTSHRDPINPSSSSSSSPRFLSDSVPRWFVPSSSLVPHHRPSAAQRLTTSAGAATHPP